MATLIHASRTGTGSLWQGGAEAVVDPTQNWSVIVLAADEFQPSASLFLKPDHGKTLIYAPNDDSDKPLTREQVQVAIAAARQVAKAYRAGKKILVSCMQGRNRSGFIMAMTLHLLYGMSGGDAIRFVQSKVPNSLMNPGFNKFLRKMPSRTKGEIGPTPRMQAFRGGRDGRDD